MWGMHVCVVETTGHERVFTCVWNTGSVSHSKLCLPISTLDDTPTPPHPTPVLPFYRPERKHRGPFHLPNSVVLQRREQKSRKFSSLAGVTLWLFFKGGRWADDKKKHAASNTTTHGHNYREAETKGAVKMRRWWGRWRIRKSGADSSLSDCSGGLEVRQRIKRNRVEGDGEGFFFLPALFSYLSWNLHKYM